MKKQVQTAAPVAAKKVRVLVGNATRGSAQAQSVAVSPVAALTYTGCSCWAHN